MLRTQILFVSVLLGAVINGQSVVVPNANANVRGTSQLNSIIRNAGNPRSFQQGINASELSGIPVGSLITGVSLRFQVFASNVASWPSAPILWNAYDIWAGPAIPTATWSGNTSANFASAPVHVRAGPMTLDAGVFTNVNPSAPTPNAWAEFYFDFQNPYLWLGGDLALLFSHPGSLDAATALYPETVASNAATYGVGRTQSIYPAGTASAASTFYVMRLHYGNGAGCPGGSGSPPVLVLNANTTGGLGGNMVFQAGNAPPNSTVIFTFGLVPVASPLGNGCTLYDSLDLFVQQTADGNGRSFLTFPIPPGLFLTAYAQVGVLDPLAPGGFSVTNAVTPSAL